MKGSHLLKADMRPSKFLLNARMLGNCITRSFGQWDLMNHQKLVSVELIELTDQLELYLRLNLMLPWTEASCLTTVVTCA